MLSFDQDLNLHDDIYQVPEGSKSSGENLHLNTVGGMSCTAGQEAAGPP